MDFGYIAQRHDISYSILDISLNILIHRIPILDTSCFNFGYITKYFDTLHPIITFVDTKHTSPDTSLNASIHRIPMYYLCWYKTRMSLYIASRYIMSWFWYITQHPNITRPVILSFFFMQDTPVPKYLSTSQYIPSPYMFM